MAIQSYLRLAVRCDDADSICFTLRLRKEVLAVSSVVTADAVLVADR